MKLLTTIGLFIFLTQLKAQIVGLQSSYTAGDQIVFYHPTVATPLTALVIHSHGSHLVVGKPEKSQTIFEIPLELSKKRGLLSISIRNEDQVLVKGETHILAAENDQNSIESYCGPKHLVAGINDHSMIIATVLDPYDNPFPDSTLVEFKSNMEGQISSKLQDMEFLVAYDRFYAPSKVGYGALTTAYHETSSKEFRLIFYANDPENFTITSAREHEFADGNQLIAITTSEIRDPFFNLIENGTLVEFRIITREGKRYQAHSETIGGKATIELPAPAYETHWNVQAFIPEYAKSNTLTLEFIQSLKQLPIQITSEELVVGPLTGYMDQFIKEGTPVAITLKKESNTYEFVLNSEYGFVHLNYEKYLLPKGEFSALIQVANLSKSTKLIVQ